MQFEKIRTINKRKMIIGGVISLGVISALIYLPSRAKYRTTESFNIVNGTINYRVPDMNLVAMYTIKDGVETAIDTVPISEYILNTEKSLCSVNGEKIDASIEYKDGKLYFGELTQRGTKCSVYFDIVKDTTIPTIASVTQTSMEEKTSISVSVDASDDKEVTEYWYAIDEEAAVQGTSSTHTFTGLTAGSSYTVSVYVKDAAGNQSTTWSGTMKTKAEGISSGDIIAGTPEEAPSSKFASVATTDEGVFSVADPVYGGTSYYYRGAVTNNYVKFAGYCWRIIRINGDGTIRMIYDGTTCHANGTSTAESIVKTSQAYNSSYNASYYVGYIYGTTQRPSNNETATASNLKTQTESWYKINITDKGYDGKVAEGKFCNDRNTASGSTWSTSGNSFYYAARGRLQTNKAPTLACPSGDIYILKAGALVADEVSFAGGVYETANSKYYLYNGQNYWTMSPYGWNTSYDRNYPLVFIVNSNGSIKNTNVDNASGYGYSLDIRPVINLHADTIFKADTDGTLNNPYVVQ